MTPLMLEAKITQAIGHIPAEAELNAAILLVRYDKRKLIVLEHAATGGQDLLELLLVRLVQIGRDDGGLTLDQIQECVAITYNTEQLIEKKHDPS